MLDTITREARAMEADAKGVLETVKDKAMDAASAVGDFAGTAKDKAVSALSQVGETAQDLTSTAVDKVQDFGKDLTSLIRQHPMPALLIALGVGFALARLTSRSSA